MSAQHRGEYDVLTEAGELRAHVAGRLLHDASSGADLPAVGDWVALRDEVIHAVLPRRTAFARKVTLGNTEAQVLAANVDTVFVVTALDDDFSPSRIERYLTLAWESGALPALVLTKADLCDDPLALLLQAEQVAVGAPAHVVSNVTGEGLDELAPYLAAGAGRSPCSAPPASASRRSPTVCSGTRRSRRRSSRRTAPAVTPPPRASSSGSRAVRCSWTRPACARFSSGTPTRASTRPLPTSTSWPPAVASTTAPTCTSPAARCRRRSARARLPRERLQSYRALQRELRRLAAKQDARLRSEEKKKRVAFAKSRRKSAW